MPKNFTAVPSVQKGKEEAQREGNEPRSTMVHADLRKPEQNCLRATASPVGQVLRRHSAVGQGVPPSPPGLWLR